LKRLVQLIAQPNYSHPGNFPIWILSWEDN
jgi:hypothetical protein